LERVLQLAFSQLALITITLYRPYEKLFNFTVDF
jgi:hypothetical protein